MFCGTASLALFMETANNLPPVTVEKCATGRAPLPDILLAGVQRQGETIVYVLQAQRGIIHQMESALP